MLSLIAAALDIIQRWCLRRSTRRALRRLDATALSDIGRSEDERQRECAKWFWQA